MSDQPITAQFVAIYFGKNFHRKISFLEGNDNIFIRGTNSEVNLFKKDHNHPTNEYAIRYEETHTEYQPNVWSWTFRIDRWSHNDNNVSFEPPIYKDKNFDAFCKCMMIINDHFEKLNMSAYTDQPCYNGYKKIEANETWYGMYYRLPSVTICRST